MSLLGLVPDYGDDSSSSDSENDEEQTPSTVNQNTSSSCLNSEVETPLPLPELDVGKKTSSLPSELKSRAFESSSVFYNPYLVKEKERLSVLEKHVQLSEQAPTLKGKKRVCWKFQKGKCRFGEKCKFVHNTIPVGATSANEPDSETAAPHTSVRTLRYTPNEEETQWEEKKSKKRRVGVTDSLVPPKRAVKAYEQQKVRERPWMQ
ncbi:predicted protein [Nematostella vectensis]|uniref:C3H1-type domain-containing protein n=1 Tax=Nematostella vectensis TaxID=45351 RepID=A7SW99_NEMVE|nr:predicted protein [Nematostella vectensis]|eukprot:XP_001624126.1 predicted protein [Nematostella vectensis]